VKTGQLAAIKVMNVTRVRNCLWSICYCIWYLHMSLLLFA